MIAEKALSLAGPGACLVARPRGRAHVYVGPLTSSGGAVPSSRRAVCRARTLRLRVVQGRESSLVCTGPRLCARCAACLAQPRPLGQASTLPHTRDAYLTAYTGLTKADIALGLQLAVTPAEVDAAAHLSLLLFTIPGCAEPFTERGRSWSSLEHLVTRARARVGGFVEQDVLDRRMQAHREAATSTRREDRRLARQERDDRIERLGFSNSRRAP